MRGHTTLSVLEEKASKQILRAKIWPYCFDKVFLQVLIEFLLSFFCSILTAKKIEKGQVLMAFYRSPGNSKLMGYVG